MDRTGRDVSFCSHVILGDDALVVPDATRDPRFEDNPLVTGDLGLRYYAGVPISSQSTGYRLGAVCVIDRSIRTETSQAQRTVLTKLAKMAAAFIEQKVTGFPPST